MINKIKQLEKIALNLEPNSNERALLLENVLEYTDLFLEELTDLPACVMSDDNGRALYENCLFQKTA